MHLTNYSVNKKSGNYVSCDDPEVEDFGNKWSMSGMLRYLKQEGINTTELMSHVEELIVKTVMAVESPIASAIKMFVPHRGNCFELYGFDVLIDSDLKPWLLEVNLSPSLACDAPLDLKIKASMVADMFSLVGFICQDPSVNRHRGARDGSARHSSRPQRPFSSQVSSGVHRLASTNITENKHIPRTLALSSEETKVLRRVQEEYARRGSFIRIFPTQHTWELYSGFLEYRTSLNTMLASYLFTDGTATPLTVHSNQLEARQRARRAMCGRDVVRSSSQSPSNTLQYERKLLSLEKRGERQRRHKGKRKKGQAHKVAKEVTMRGEHQELTCSMQEEGAGSNDDHPDMMAVSKDITPSVKHTEPALQGNLNVSSGTHSRRSAAILFLEAGKSLSKVQARHTFSSYLQRVRQRLIKESCILKDERESRLEDEKMDIVVQFMCRAAENLQQPIRLAVLGRKLPLNDRKRILGLQLGEFLHYYNLETQQVSQKNWQEGKVDDDAMPSADFHVFIETASETELEEVLTFYTQCNKHVGVFPGTTMHCSKQPLPPTQSKHVPATSLVSETLQGDIISSSHCATGATTTDKIDTSRSEIHPAACCAINMKTISECLKQPCTFSGDEGKLSSSHQTCGFRSREDLVTTSSITDRGIEGTTQASSCCAVTYLPRPVWNENVTDVMLPQPFDGKSHQRMGEESQQQTSSRHQVSGQSSSAIMSSIRVAAQIYKQKLCWPMTGQRGSSMVTRARTDSALPMQVAQGTTWSMGNSEGSPESIIAALAHVTKRQASRHLASSHIRLLTEHLPCLNFASGALAAADANLPLLMPLAEGAAGIVGRPTQRLPQMDSSITHEGQQTNGRNISLHREGRSQCRPVERASPSCDESSYLENASSLVERAELQQPHHLAKSGHPRQPYHMVAHLRSPPRSSFSGLQSRALDTSAVTPPRPSHQDNQKSTAFLRTKGVSRTASPAERPSHNSWKLARPNHGEQDLPPAVDQNLLQKQSRKLLAQGRMEKQALLAKTRALSPVMVPSPARPRPLLGCTAHRRSSSPAVTPPSTTPSLQPHKALPQRRVVLTESLDGASATSDQTTATNIREFATNNLRRSRSHLKS
uniref:Tubulin--tyrosine ligase-like protein 5 n=1 Tax=Eptatretus burgeri TaxID=7764 RepID=A0A8C4QL41_EPTBU